MAGTVRTLAATLAFGLLASSAAAAPTTTRVSFNLDGSQSTRNTWKPAMSDTGNQIAYEVLLGDGRIDDTTDIHLYDRTTGRTEWISAGLLGLAGNGNSERPSISADGRFVAFSSSSDNLVPGDTNDTFDIFVRDRRTGDLERIEEPVDGHAFHPSLAPGGRFVAYESEPSQTGEQNRDVLLHDRKTGETEVINKSGPSSRSDSSHPSVSARGRAVAFESGSDVWVNDRALGTIDMVAQPREHDAEPAISDSGRFVVFTGHNVLVADRKTGATEAVSVTPNGRRGNGVSGQGSISPNGRFVAFWSEASDLVPGDTNDELDVFVRDRRTDTTRRVDISTARNQANYSSPFPLSYDYGTAISPGGRFVAFPSHASNLVAGDTNGVSDIFVRGPLAW